MAEVLSPPATSSSPSPHTPRSPADSSESLPSLSQISTSREPRPQPRERIPSYAQNRMSQYSRSSQRSRPQSTSMDYPAFPSTLPYALVRDFAYPVFHTLHYGAELDPSTATTPSSDWNPGRRSSDPMEQWHGATAAHPGWSAGPWGGDGVMYDDPEHEAGIGPLPSTSFAAADGHEGLDFGDDELSFKKGKHRKSKSYANISEFERGRRRESGRRSGAGDGVFVFHGQQTDPAGRDSLRQSRGYNEPNSGARRDSHFAATLPNRSFHHSHPANHGVDPDERIPLDTEPRDSHSPIRDSMGPEDEELFAGPSLALYNFNPENANELRLVEGQEIMVSYRHGQGWLVASDPRTGEQGLVPEAYVRLIAEMPNYDPETGQFVDMEDEVEDDVESPEAENGWDGTGDGTPVPVPAEDDEGYDGAVDRVTGSEEDSDSPVELTAKKLDGNDARGEGES